MGKNSGITWTTHTFNHVRGCDEVSPGCAHCYAKTLAKRNPLTLGTWGSENEGGVRVVAAEAMWREPLKWNREADGVRPRVFNASLADWAEDWQGAMVDHKGNELVKCHGCGKEGRRMDIIDCGGSNLLCERMPRKLTMNDVRKRLFNLIDATPNLDWLMLTKRPQNIASMWREREGTFPCDSVTGAFRQNVWLGTTVENQKYADLRIPELLKCRDLAPILFLSVEPMLGEVNLSSFLLGSRNLVPWSCDSFQPSDDPMFCKCNSGISHHRKSLVASTIDWVIVGCESGPGRRPMQLDWARDLRDQCKAAGVSFFVKQLEVDGRVTDDINQFPEDLRIQEFPKAC